MKLPLITFFLVSIFNLQAAQNKMTDLARTLSDKIEGTFGPRHNAIHFFPVDQNLSIDMKEVTQQAWNAFCFKIDYNVSRTLPIPHNAYALFYPNSPQLDTPEKPFIFPSNETIQDPDYKNYVLVICNFLDKAAVKNFKPNKVIQNAIRNKKALFTINSSIQHESEVEQLIKSLGTSITSGDIRERPHLWNRIKLIITNKLFIAGSFMVLGLALFISNTVTKH